MIQFYRYSAHRDEERPKERFISGEQCDRLAEAHRIATEELAKMPEDVRKDYESQLAQLTALLEKAKRQQRD